MHIICPHCTTSYAIDLATLGVAGRTVRCSRCKEVWLARPEDATELAAPVPAMAAASARSAGGDAAAEGEALARQDDGHEGETPVVDSPSISGDWPASAGDEGSPRDIENDWPSLARHDVQDTEAARQHLSWFRKLFRPPAPRRAPAKSFISLPPACTATSALVLALIIWRVEVVRLLPQTAMVYKMVGLEVNLRGLMFKDVKITSETVEGKPVLVIEGVIVGEGRKPVELPRRRFSVRNAQAAASYAWTSVLARAALTPGGEAGVNTRRASPPHAGRHT